MKKRILPQWISGLLMILLMTVLLMTAILSGCGADSAEKNTYEMISMEEAADRFAQTEDYVILDVRTAAEFAEGHIPGALNVANEAIGSEEIAELPDKEQVIYVYCRSGNRSKQAAEKLCDLGYTNVIEIGGIKDWNGEIEKKEG